MNLVATGLSDFSPIALIRDPILSTNLFSICAFPHISLFAVMGNWFSLFHVLIEHGMQGSQVGLDETAVMIFLLV